MNDMRDLENGFKREPLGVGVGDWLPGERALIEDNLRAIKDELYNQPPIRRTKPAKL